MKLKVGQQVELKYRSFSASAPPPTFERITTIKGTVIASPKWLKPNEIAIATGNPEFPMAVLQSEQIVGYSQPPVKQEVRKFNVKSGDKVYSVIYSNGSFSCTCVGFSFRGRCKHVDAVAKKIQNG